MMFSSFACVCCFFFVFFCCSIVVHAVVFVCVCMFCLDFVIVLFILSCSRKYFSGEGGVTFVLRIST